jgi:hypothetical protein
MTAIGQLKFGVLVAGLRLGYGKAPKLSVDR